MIDLGCHLEEQLNPTRADLQVSTKSQTSLALSRTQETWGALSVPLQLTTFEDDENLEIVELMSMIIKMMVIKMVMIKLEKRADCADTSVLFFGLAVLFFASGHASTVFCILL